MCKNKLCNLCPFYVGYSLKELDKDIEALLNLPSENSSAIQYQIIDLIHIKKWLE